MKRSAGIITTIRVWSKSGVELATFNSTLHKSSMTNISLNDIMAFMADTNRSSGSAKHFGETLVVTINDAEKDVMLSKLKQIFREFKQTISL